jgi:hypothetical protein
MEVEVPVHRHWVARPEDRVDLLRRHLEISECADDPGRRVERR